MKISAVYKITNTITGDFYIGSSKDVKLRFACHKCASTWKEYPNNPMYLDMKKYGVEKFSFQILEEAEIECLKKEEQKFIETLKPTYNDRNANGWNINKYKEYQKSDKYKDYQKEYQKSDKYKDYKNKYNNQICSYNNEILTLNTLSMRFRKAGVEHPTLEAKKYLLK